MNLKKYNQYQKKLTIFFLILPIAGGAVSYLALENARLSAITAGFLILSWIPAYLLYRLDDQYISGVVEDLSRLCENLAALEEKEIFPGRNRNRSKPLSQTFPTS